MEILRHAIKEANVTAMVLCLFIDIIHEFSEAVLTVEGLNFMKLDILTFTADLKGYLLTGRIQPYALVGLGFMRVDSEETAFFFAFDFTDFATRLGGGVDYYFTENIVFGLELGGVLPTGTLKDQDQFTFSAGLHYRF